MIESESPATWAHADEYWASCQHQDGGWGYTPNPGIHATASMICAGISSLLLLRPNRLANREPLEGEAVRGCGRVFPEPESQLHSLAADHPVWRARHALTFDVHPLWGLERGDRTVLIYSPGDLSCGWNLRDRFANVLATELPLRVGQNVVDFATGRKPPPDKLASFEPGPPTSLK